MENETRVIARVDAAKYRKLRHLLLDQGVSFSDWMRRCMDAFLAENEPKRKRKGRGA